MLLTSAEYHHKRYWTPSLGGDISKLHKRNFVNTVVSILLFRRSYLRVTSIILSIFCAYKIYLLFKTFNLYCLKCIFLVAIVWKMCIFALEKRISIRRQFHRRDFFTSCRNRFQVRDRKQAASTFFKISFLDLAI